MRKKCIFFAYWVSKFLAFSNRNEDLGPVLRIKNFINRLKSQNKIAGWQIMQAEDVGILEQRRFEINEKEMRG